MFSCQEWRRQRKKVYCLRKGDRTVAAERAVGPEMRTSKGEKFSRTECRICLKGMEMGLDWVAVLSCISWGERGAVVLSTVLQCWGAVVLSTVLQCLLRTLQGAVCCTDDTAA